MEKFPLTHNLYRRWVRQQEIGKIEYLLLALLIRQAHSTPRTLPWGKGIAESRLFTLFTCVRGIWYSTFCCTSCQFRYGILQKFYDEKQRTYCGDKHGLPLIVSINRTVNAIVGRPISLTAEFCCHPSPRKVFWIHRHLALAPGRIIGPYVTKSIHESSRNCYTSTFDIDAIKPEDAGVISFIVSNSNGLDDVELTLNVTRVEFSVSGATPSSHIPLRYSAHLLLLLLLFVIKAMT